MTTTRGRSERATATSKTWVLSIASDGRRSRKPDSLVGEEPLEIRAGGPGQEHRSLAVTMRTPGNDFELACGYLLTESLIAGPEDIRAVKYCVPAATEQLYNVVSVDLSVDLPQGLERNRAYATSSCGICGKASLDELAFKAPKLTEGPFVNEATVAALPDRLRKAQRVFAATGGLHAAALFTAGGEMVAAREDVGRHNTVDKLVGKALLEKRWPIDQQILMVSGRVGYEIVQKAAVAGISVVCAVSAPSSLAVQAANEMGLTLAGFVRPGGFNVYANAERIMPSA